MIDSETLLQVIGAGEEHRAARRQFLRSAGAVSLAAGSASLLSACSGSSGGTTNPTPTPTATSTSVAIDVDALNFALNLEYLLAQFSAYATSGTSIASSLLTGTGTQGTVIGGRAVTFTDATVAEFAREIAADDLAHLSFLRSALGASANAMPTINIDGGATGAYTQAARLAGYVTSPATFDPYASDTNFLLAAYFLKDVAVTAYKGAAQLITNTLYVDAAAGLFTTQAYHAGLLRTTLYTKGLGAASEQFSSARDNLDGNVDNDQGVAGSGSAANITPADGNGAVYTRTAGQVLNIAYLNSAAVTSGGFFPNGVNGNTNTSAASVVAAV